MNFKWTYFIVVVLFILSLIAFVFNKKIAFFLMGYSADLIYSNSSDVFEAYEKTYPLRIAIYFLCALLTILTGILSKLAFSKEEISSYWPKISLSISLIVLLFLILSWIGSMLSGPYF